MKKLIAILFVITMVLLECITVCATNLNESGDVPQNESILENKAENISAGENNYILNDNDETLNPEIENPVLDVEITEDQNGNNTDILDNGPIEQNEISDFTETIIGRLQSVNLNNFTVKIDGKDYSVGADFEMNTAVEILNNHDNKIVIAALKNGEVDMMDDVTEVIVPQLKLSADTSGLTYLDGKMSPDKFVGKATVGCSVRKPYEESDFEELEDRSLISISLKNIYLDTMGYGLYFEKGGWFSQNKTNIVLPVNITLQPGESKECLFDVYIEDDYRPAYINQSLSINANLVSEEGGEDFDTMNIPVGNVDLQREEQETKKAKRNSTKEIQTAVNSLDGLNIAIDETRLSEYFTLSEIKNIKKCVSLWVSDIIASTSLVHNDDNGVINTIRKKTSLTDDDIMSSVLKKMGVNENVLSRVGNTKATTQITATGKKGDKVTIFCSLNLGYNAFKKTPPYGAFGTLDYYIIDKGNRQNSYAKSEIAYTNINTFVDQLQKIAESNIKSAYGEVWGKKADKVAEMIVGETICKILKKTTGGSFSDNVFTLFSNQTTNYTKKMSVHCPVDVYVYDADGNICGAIKNNIVDPSYNSIYMYVNGTEKFFYLTEDDYTIRFLGSDKGEMQYTVEEYSEDGLLRCIEYHNIPLSNGQEYYSSVPDAVYLDNVVYDPVTSTGDAIDPDMDSWQDNLTKKISTNGVTLNMAEIDLNIGEEYKLIVNVLPINATNKEVDWIIQDEAIASVTDEGVVKGITAGETLIQAVTVDGGFIAECKITVKHDKKNPSDTPVDKSKPITENPLDTKENPSISASPQIKTQTTKNIAPKTGDNEKLILWMVLWIVSIGIVVSGIYLNIYKKDNTQ